MKALLRKAAGFMASTGLIPVVLILILCLYVGISFYTDEALVTLMAFAKQSGIALLLMIIFPVNFICRVLVELKRHRSRQRCMRGAAGTSAEGLFEESINVPAGTAEKDPRQFLENSGFRVTAAEGILAARKGISLLPSRILLVTATALLLTGVAASLAFRSSQRVRLIEGEPLPLGMEGEVVERIRLLTTANGLLLAQRLLIDVAVPGQSPKIFDIYPPSRSHGRFVYPRYLAVGVAAEVRAPGLAPGQISRHVLQIYPPGREEQADIPGTPFRMHVRLLQTEGEDQFSSGRFRFFVRLSALDNDVISGEMLPGGILSAQGTSISFPDVRRIALTDMITDPGVIPIWLAGVLFIGGILLWLPVRIISPRCEILVSREGAAVRAHLYTEGNKREHLGVFNEVLDMIALDETTVTETRYESG
jgi:hypothetical protein